jgi:hypothetical protein
MVFLSIFGFGFGFLLLGIKRFSHRIWSNTNINDCNQENPLYLIVWEDCESRSNLLREMRELDIQYLVIDPEIFLRELCLEQPDVEYLYDKPLFYRDHKYIGCELFDIYSRIYRDSDGDRQF